MIFLIIVLLVSIIDVPTLYRSRSVTLQSGSSFVSFAHSFHPETSSRSVPLSLLLQSMQSINLSHKLRAFLLRCLILWPRILRNIRKVWFWFFQKSSNDGKEEKRSTGWPSSSRALRDHEEYSVVCASRAFERGDKQSLGRSLSRHSDVEESIQLGDVTGGSPSVSHSPSSFYPPPLQDSPLDSVNPLSTGDINHSSTSLRPEGPLTTMELTVHRSSTPVSGTHSRATSRQFTGASSRRRSLRRSPSPSLSLFRRQFSRPGTPSGPDIENPTRPTVVLGSPHSHEDSAQSPTGITFQVEQPSAPGSPFTSSSSLSRHSPLQGQTQGFPVHHQLSSAESVDSSADSTSSRGNGSSVSSGSNGYTRRSQGSIQGRSSTPRLNQAPPQLTIAFPEPIVFPRPSVSRVSIQVSPTVVLTPQAEPGLRKMRPMNPEQVSRYMKKGDV